jgi:hypothetical protein
MARIFYGNRFRIPMKNGMPNFARVASIYEVGKLKR